jgi:hypothetical protein
MSPSLSLVPVEPAPAKAETVADRIRRLQAEVQALGREQVAQMRANVIAGIEAAREVATNPTQPDGVRQLAERIARDGDSLLLTLDQITARSAR